MATRAPLIGYKSQWKMREKGWRFSPVKREEEKLFFGLVTLSYSGRLSKEGEQKKNVREER